MPDSFGTWVWRLDGHLWTRGVRLSSSTASHADVRSLGDVAHILLFEGVTSELASVQYAGETERYRPWAKRLQNVTVTLDEGVETATIDLDSQGRMWLASDAVDQVKVRCSDTPYEAWKEPILVATGISPDDISMVMALPKQKKVGVFWSNQNTGQFGFRLHQDGDSPESWTEDEVPASHAALPVGKGMADDHMNAAVGSDGTVYVAVKTSYDRVGYPKIALLVRRPVGTWDDLYEVDQSGTRGIVLLNELASSVMVVYTGREGGGDILFRESATSSICFSPRKILIRGPVNDATSTKQTIDRSLVVLASGSNSASGVLRHIASQR
jgi:hypothetical protein